MVEKDFNAQSNIFIEKYEAAIMVWKCSVCSVVDSHLAYMFCGSRGVILHSTCLTGVSKKGEWICQECVE